MPVSIDNREAARDRVIDWLREADVDPDPFRQAYDQFDETERLPTHWSGLTRTGLIRELEEIEDRFDWFGDAFHTMAYQTWAGLSSEAHSRPEWQWLQLTSAMRSQVVLGEIHETTEEYHLTAARATYEMLRGVRRVVSEARDQPWYE
jgi:hypothetical protein